MLEGLGHARIPEQAAVRLVMGGRREPGLPPRGAVWAEVPVGSRALHAIHDTVLSRAPDARNRAWHAQEHRPSLAPRPGRVRAPYRSILFQHQVSLVLSSLPPPEACYSLVFHINLRTNFPSVCNEVGEGESSTDGPPVS